MYCKICKHNFNTGESYVKIGDVVICADCAFKTTVRDLAAKGVFPVITMDDGAIPVDFVVDGEPSLETRPEKTKEELNAVYGMNATPEEIPVPNGKQVLASAYGKFASPEEITVASDISPLVVLFTHMSGRKGYYIFADKTDFNENKQAMLNLMDIHFTTMDEIPSEYEFELDFRA